MKTIGIDCRFAGGQTGLGRFTRELTSALIARGDHVTYVLFVRSASESWISTLRGGSPFRIVTADIPHYSLAEHLRFPKIIASSACDIFLAMHFNVPLRCPVPFVAVIHDLILHASPGSASLLRRAMYRMQMGYTIRASLCLLPVSTYTALEIGGAYGHSAFQKARVIGEGVGREFAPVPDAEVHRVLTKYGISQPYVLYVGSVKPHKHVDRLLQAWDASGVADLAIVLVAPNGKRLAAPYDRARVLSPVDDDDLPCLYSGAQCFVTASMHEGFCLPIAEALSCGCPVIAPRSTAIPETASGSACLVHGDVSSLAAAIASPPKRPVRYSRPRWSAVAARVSEALREVHPGR